MNKKQLYNKIFEELERVANFIPIPFYWLDTKGIVLGANDIVFMEYGGLETKSQIIGKANHSFYPKEIANVLIENNQKVINLGQTVEFEEKVADINGNIRYFTAIRSPIRTKDGIIIGIVGTSIEITDKKQAELHRVENERLKLENEKHAALAREHADELVRTIQAAVATFLNKDINKPQTVVKNPEIKLTSREANVLYALYHKKNAKSASNYLSKKLNKNFTHESVNTVVSRCLYPKFEVNSIDELITKAVLLKMIPLFFPEKKNKKKSD